MIKIYKNLEEKKNSILRQVYHYEYI